MKRLIHRRDSIYVQAALLLITAVMIAGIHFLAADSMSERLVEWYIARTDYFSVQNQKAVAALQEYINSERLCSRDAEALDRWVKKQRLLDLTIYKNGILVFDSRYPDQAVWEEEIGFFDYDWINYNAVEFVDGTAEIQVSGAFRYQVYSTIRVIILSTSFLVFLLIILLGIRKKIVYIRELSDEVEVLEGGGLHHPITVRGSDELSALAEGLETMRTSFLESQKKEEWVVRENRRIITEMSHDLRTPCTSIILYAEILLNGKCADERKQKKYLEKILLKAYQIKERSDRLLGFSISQENREEQVLEKGTFSEVFHDLLSEMCGYLEQNGFTVKLNTLLPEVEITYNMDHVVRIMDNIASNIVKYADPEYPVMITQTGGDNKELDNTVGLRFHNRIARPETAPEGFNIGVQSVSSLMKEMGGSCRLVQNGDAYCIEILFNFRNEYVG